MSGHVDIRSGIDHPLREIDAEGSTEIDSLADNPPIPRVA
jgi:hypothetical protein